MQGFVLDAERGPALRAELPVPAPAAGEALVRVLRSGLCSTDLEMIRGYKAGFQGVLGHEFVGVVEAVAEPRHGAAWVGRRVVGEINVAGPAGEFYGLEGAAVSADLRRNHDPRRTCLGIVGKDGAHAEYLTLPLANLFAVPDGVSDAAATFCEPVAAACRIVEQGLIAPGDRVAIVGDGKLGLLIAEVLGRQGLARKPTVFGRHGRKLGLLVGLCETVATADAPNALAERESSFDVVVEASGSPDGLASATTLAWLALDVKVI
jgi:threonine dehydrogenase-like Zn-dependent dehydrogenase